MKIKNKVKISQSNRNPIFISFSPIFSFDSSWFQKCIKSIKILTVNYFFLPNYVRYWQLKRHTFLIIPDFSLLDSMTDESEFSSSFLPSFPLSLSYFLTLISSLPQKRVKRKREGESRRRKNVDFLLILFWPRKENFSSFSRF